MGTRQGPLPDPALGLLARNDEALPHVNADGTIGHLVQRPGWSTQ